MSIERSMAGEMLSAEKNRARKLEKCPHCDYILIERTTYCPYCGTQVTYTVWKKAGAWILLFLIIYFLVKCHVQIMDGFD
jgi:RNA polymerase subunit RPABC4/transcription elongation factor Spt4